MKNDNEKTMIAVLTFGGLLFLFLFDWKIAVAFILLRIAEEGIKQQTK